MKNRLLLSIAFSCGLAVAPVGAQELQDHLIAQLQQQGFTIVEVKSTWLGRTRIEAVSGSHERELIVNSRTGEILRDYWEALDEDDVALPSLINPKASTDSSSEASGGGGSGGADSGSGAGSQAWLDVDEFDYLLGGRKDDVDFA